MTRSLRALTALVLGSAFAVAACASDASSSGGAASSTDAGTTPVADAATATDAGAVRDSGTTPAADAGTTKPQWTLRLTVPRDYSGTPRQLAVVLVNSLPVTGIPAAFLKFEDNPTVAAGQEIRLSGDVPANRGPFKVLAALYMQGGGQFSPKPGTDYDAATANFVEVTGASVDFGTLPLALHTANDGH
jgi:hypothetical protein